ncbi:hypothetical protein JNUCC1_02678 [Lentibacillus sp. JNUCC-1]|nr:hypothetical protein [Lentibacillus sp. JNUCC-1]
MTTMSLGVPSLILLLVLALLVGGVWAAVRLAKNR